MAHWDADTERVSQAPHALHQLQQLKLHQIYIKRPLSTLKNKQNQKTRVTVICMSKQYIHDFLVFTVLKCWDLMQSKEEQISEAFDFCFVLGVW